MYFTSLPDHTKPGFDEELHFSKFKKHNIIFNALSSSSNCDNHVGCLSFKTVLSGEDWYGINQHRVALRPGQFLILNDDQNYSSNSDNGEKLRVLSVFFKKEFASAVFRDALSPEEQLLNDPVDTTAQTLEFFQTLNHITPELQCHISALLGALETHGYDEAMMDEYLVFLLHQLIRMHKSESKRVELVSALKSNTRTEIYKRLCTAKDILHSTYMERSDLNTISSLSCLSVPQLVRQFKAVFHVTPHQYLIRIRLKHAADLLTFTKKPIHEITWMCGFEDVSAFCRAFKSGYGVQPMNFRRTK